MRRRGGVAVSITPLLDGQVLRPSRRESELPAHFGHTGRILVYSFFSHVLAACLFVLDFKFGGVAYHLSVLAFVLLVADVIDGVENGTFRRASNGHQLLLEVCLKGDVPMVHPGAMGQELHVVQRT